MSEKDGVKIGQVWQVDDGRVITIKKIYFDAWYGYWCAEWENGVWSGIHNILARCKLIQEA
jgi:hypothetical protein